MFVNALHVHARKLIAQVRKMVFLRPRSELRGSVSQQPIRAQHLERGSQGRVVIVFIVLIVW